MNFRARNRDVRQRTISEVNLLYKLHHPQILSLIAAYESPTHVVNVDKVIVLGNTG